MYKGFCHTCQIFVETSNKYCEKCYRALEIIQTASTPVPENLSSNLALQIENQTVSENFSETGGNNSAEVNISNARFGINPTTNSHQRNYQPTSKQSYPNYTPHYPTQNYQKYQTNNSNSHYNSLNYSLTDDSRLRSMVRYIVFTVLFLACFGITLSITYNQYLDKKAGGTESTQGTATETQKPWFSHWFKTNPTAEEIFDKYETATLIKGKNLKSQTMVLRGNIEFNRTIAPSVVKTAGNSNPEIPKGIRNPLFGENNVPQSQISTSPVVSTNPKDEVGQLLEKFNTEIEISMKLPDKVLVKMTMTPKDKMQMRGLSVVAYQGMHGNEKWTVIKTYFNGTKNIASDNAPSGIEKIFSEDTKAIVMTIQQEMYQKGEVEGKKIYDGKKYYVVKATKPNGDTDTIYFDIETGLIKKYENKDYDIHIFEYRGYNGVIMPYKFLQFLRKQNQGLFITVSDMIKDVELDDSKFLKSSYQ